MASQKAVFTPPNTEKKLKVNVEQRPDGIRIFFDQGDMIEDGDIPHNKAIEFEDQREYLFYSNDEYEKLKTDGKLIVTPPESGGRRKSRRVKKRRATRRAKKRTRRSKS
jgi:hypothetical protein